jgi:hypothetical protein
MIITRKEKLLAMTDLRSFSVDEIRAEGEGESYKGCVCLCLGSPKNIPGFYCWMICRTG